MPWHCFFYFFLHFALYKFYYCCSVSPLLSRCAIFHQNLANHFLLLSAFGLNIWFSAWTFHFYIPVEVCSTFFQLLSQPINPSILTKHILVFIFSVKLQLLDKTPCPFHVPNKCCGIIQILLHSSASGRTFRKIKSLIPKPMKLSVGGGGLFSWTFSQALVQKSNKLPLKKVQNCNDLKLHGQKTWQRCSPACQDQDQPPISS